jgi:hypothetical protein
VIDTQPWNSGVQRIKLSTPIQSGINSSYSASIYRLRNNTLQRNLPVSIESGSQWLRISNLSETLSPPADGYNGDYVIIGLDTVNKRTFRVSGIEPLEDGSVRISGVLWTPKIHDTSNLVVLN